MMTMSLWAYTWLYSKSVSYTPPSPLWLSVMGNGNYPKMITPSGSPMQLLQHFVSICGHISVLLLTHSKMSVPHLQAGHILQASLPAMGIHLDPLAIPTLWYSCFMTNHIVHQRQSKGIVWRGPMQRRTNYLWLKSLPKFLKITKEPGAIFESSFCQDCLYHSGGVLKGACSSKDVRVGFALWRECWAHALREACELGCVQQWCCRCSSKSYADVGLKHQSGVCHFKEDFCSGSRRYLKGLKCANGGLKHLLVSAVR